MKTIALVMCLSLALPLAACGGGGGNDDNNNNNPIQQTINSTGNLDGNVAADNSGNVDVGGANAIPIVGDDPFQMGNGSLERRGLWSFDLSSIPNNATITSATLRLFVSGTAGNPSAMNGLLRVDHVNFGTTFPIFNLATPIALDFAQINDLTTTGERLIDVTARVQNDVDNTRGRSQYRVRGAAGTNNDPQADWVIFTDQDNTAVAANRPTLMVEYTTP